MDKIIKNTLGSSFGLAGLGIGLGLVGSSFDNENISNAGSTATGFISPMINIGMAGFTIKMLKNLKDEN